MHQKIISQRGNQHRQLKIHRLLIGTASTGLFWFSSYVASHHLAVTPQSGAKDKFCYAVYNITLNSNCEAQRISKNLGKNVEDQKSKLAKEQNQTTES
jgi:hypothetical protein